MGSSDPGLRPDNAPIIVVPDATGTLAFITLRGGRLIVVDPTITPIDILAEYDTTTVNANGFGGIEANGRPNPMSGAPMRRLAARQVGV